MSSGGFLVPAEFYYEVKFRLRYPNVAITERIEKGGIIASVLRMIGNKHGWKTVFTKEYRAFIAQERAVENDKSL